MKINDLLIKESILTDKFNRYDILVKYYTIKEYLNANPSAFDLYSKMQIARMGNRIDNIDLSIEIFKKYIAFYIFYKGVKSRGILVDIKPILIGKDDKMLDGSHRLSCSIYFNENEINVERQDRSSNVPYNKEWFKQNKFTEKELELFEEIKKEIILKGFKK